MKITDNHNLPEALVKACLDGNERPERGIYRVTALADAPLIRYLQMTYWDELEQDVSELLWSAFGKIGHMLMEKHAPDNTYVEERVDLKKDGVIVTGKPDLVSLKSIDDWKFTSVWAILLGIKPVWKAQLNTYDFMYSEHGLANVDTLIIHAMLRDWQKGKRFEEGYPKIQYMRKQVEKWSREKQDDYISRRIELHKEAEKGVMIECTPEEKWQRPTTYAVMKKGNKRATKVCADLSTAESVAENIKGAEVVTRVGSNIRCDDYCIVSDVCPFNNAERKVA